MTIKLHKNEIEYLIRCTESDSHEVLGQIIKSEDSKEYMFDELYFKIKLIGKLEVMLDDNTTIN